MGWEKIIDILNWAKDKIPLQNRVERWKNEIDKLEKRQVFIEVNKRNDLRNEYMRNAQRLQDLRNYCKNKATE